MKKQIPSNHCQVPAQYYATQLPYNTMYKYGRVNMVTSSKRNIIIFV